MWSKLASPAPARCNCWQTLVLGILATQVQGSKLIRIGDNLTFYWKVVEIITIKHDSLGSLGIDLQQWTAWKGEPRDKTPNLEKITPDLGKGNTWFGRHMGRTLSENLAGSWRFSWWSQWFQLNCGNKRACLQKVHGQIMAGRIRCVKPRVWWVFHRWKTRHCGGHWLTCGEHKPSKMDMARWFYDKPMTEIL